MKYEKYEKNMKYEKYEKNMKNILRYCGVIMKKKSGVLKLQEKYPFPSYPP